MTTRDIVRHDLTVVRRTVVGKLLLGLSLGGTLGGVLAGYALSNGNLTGEFLVFSLWLVVGTTLPLGAVLTAAVTISADRESGRLRLLFGTPTTKADVFTGTLLARVVAVCGAVAVGFGAAGAVVTALSIDMSLGELARMAGFTMLICVAYTSVGVAVSALSATRLQAVAGALAFYVWSAMWPQIASIVGDSGSFGPGEPTPAVTVTHFVGTLSPFGAYSQAVTPAKAIYAEVVTGALLATPTMTAILVAWAILPVPLGYWWFSRLDL